MNDNKSSKTWIRFFLAGVFFATLGGMFAAQFLKKEDWAKTLGNLFFLFLFLYLLFLLWTTIREDK